MADIHILRKHAQGLLAIRKIAFQWAELAEAEFGMRCVYHEGRASDELFFTGPGVQGHLLATRSKLEIKVELGVLLRAFKSKIEHEMVKNIDALLPAKLSK